MAKRRKQKSKMDVKNKKIAILRDNIGSKLLREDRAAREEESTD